MDRIEVSKNIQFSIENSFTAVNPGLNAAKHPFHVFSHTYNFAAAHVGLVKRKLDHPFEHKMCATCIERFPDINFVNTKKRMKTFQVSRVL